LLTLISRILDFSKIEAGQLELQPAPFALRSSLDGVLRALGLRARHKGLALHYTVHPDVPDALIGDLNRLRQVLEHLVDNAIKFTTQGEVRVAVTGQQFPSPVIPEADRHGYPSRLLHFAITDTGIGIPPEKQRLIFDAFAQADSSSTRQYGGTGLGLTIATHIVDIMGGKIWVESQGTGTGSCFHFTARVEVQAPLETSAPQPSAPRPGHRSLHILLAEDNIINQKLMVRLLEKRGHKVVLATNGKEVLAALAQALTIDLILMDVQMPEMDGLETTTAIRALEAGQKSHVPIIALTAHALPSDRERCLEAGMDGYITKPIRPEELFETIAQYVGAPEQADSAAVEGALASDAFDHAALLARLEGDSSLCAELIGLFLEDLPQRLTALRHAIVTQEWETAEHLTHTLKGAAGNLCAHKMLDALRQMEPALQTREAGTALDAMVQLEEEGRCLQAVLTACLTSP
jgi:CheY-like chemotaxis protein/HPt (histidine-containing phosphotransfer) domain-containing protein